MNKVWGSPRVKAAVAAVLGIAAPALSAHGQPVADDGTVLEEVVVTATRREVDVQDVPFNIVAFGPETIERAANQAVWLNSTVRCLACTCRARDRAAATWSRCAAST